MKQFHHVQDPFLGRIMTINQDMPSGTEVINTGDWTPALLQYRWMTDKALTIRFIPWDLANTFDEDRSNFYWTDASGITAFYLNDEDAPWATVMDMLGIEYDNVAKLAKRFKEIVRVSRYNSSAPVNILLIAYQGNEMFVDGKNVMSRSFARKLGLKKYHNHVNLRYTYQDGTIKGDCHIISDKQMIATHGDLYDIVSPTCNLKTELRSNGWHFTTANPHHDHNHAMFDMQSASWLRQKLYPEAQIKSTLTKVIDVSLESLAAGDWPDWMVMTEDSHLDDFGHTLGQDEKAGQAYMRHHLKWQMHGMKLEHSSALIGMAANSFKARLQSRLYKKDEFGNSKPLMWLPLPWAFYGHVTTHEFLTEFCGYTIPESKKNLVIWHQESGCVSLPGDQFADTFEAHGTWDLDDSAKFFVRQDINTGEMVLIIVRSPNSDGEYSIHKMDNVENFPFYHCYGDIPKVDINTFPARIEDVQSNQVIDGLPANTRTLQPIYTRDEAKLTLDIQSTNPGIGAIANAMMVYYASTGQSPKHVLATMGDMVDCVQQVPYAEGFSAITEFTNQMWGEIIAHGKVDTYMVRTRMPQKYQGMVSAYKGYFQRLLVHFENEVLRFVDESRVIGFTIRANNPIMEINSMTSLNLDEGARWIRKAETMYTEIQQNNPGNDKFSKNRRTELNRNVMRLMVEKMRTMDTDTRNNLVLSMYRYCTIPGTDQRFRYGRSDRALFSPLTEGEITVMDYFIEALISLGVAKEVK